MSTPRDFKAEYQAFMKEYSYQTMQVNGIPVRYQFGGKEGAPVMVFFHGLEMQEMWMPYVMHFRENYRFLIYEYPFHTTKLAEQVEFTYAVLQKLSIPKVILVGSSDGGVYAQMFAKMFPQAVQAMILMTTLTLDSDYVRDIQKERFIMPIYSFVLKVIPAKTELNLLLKKSDGFLACESPENQVYGKGFYETVAMDLNYKQRFIHSVKCVYYMKDCKYFEKKDFEYLKGKIQVLVPENDIFKKEDQQRLVNLFKDLDAQILDVPGGHVGFIVQAEEYMKKMEKFLEEHL